MTTKHKPEGDAAKASVTTNGNNGSRSVTSNKSNFGQFGYTLACKLTDEQVEKILKEGILHIAQRAPASRVEKTLEGYTKRPSKDSGWTRDQIEYTEAKARQFEVEMAKEFKKEAGIDVSVVAERYEPEHRELAYAEAKKVIKSASQHGHVALTQLAKNANYTGTNLTIDNVEFVQAVETARQASLAAMFTR